MELNTQHADQTTQPIYIIGDIHGQHKQLLKVLRNARLINESHAWTGGTAVLWFMGDFVDRGPDGIAVVEFVMRLQAEALQAGGRVESLLGNHELLLLAAYRFGRRSTGLGSNFITRWKNNGGNRKDLAGLTEQSIDWLSRLPAMARVNNHLLMHADAPLYLTYGRSVEEVNAAISKLVRRSDALNWEELLDAFGSRGLFLNDHYGDEFARRFLNCFGGQQLVHGHTPISAMRQCAPKHVVEPWIYANERCVNVDGGMCLGGPGFIYQLP